MLLKREHDNLFSERPTWRKLLEQAFSDRELERETTRDRIAIALNLRPQKARNAALLLASKGVLRETTKGDPNIPPGRSFVPKHATIEKAIAMLNDLGIDPDEDI